MIRYKSSREIELMRESNLLVAKTLAEVGKRIKEGTKTIELDRIAEEFIRDNKGIPGFLNYRKFPNTLCISLNSNVVHGIPSKKEVLKEGDIVSVDCGVKLNGYFGDSAYSFTVGEVSDEKKKLLKITKECLYIGIENALVGKRLGDISNSIQRHAENNGYSVVRELTGHGIGRNLHEDPEVRNYGRRGKGVKLKKGLVIAIEPMINMGKKEVVIQDDKWTVTTKDNMPSAHFEHTIAIIDNKKADILSSFEYIEENK